jgi:TP901-1 family phage major tail protein
MVRHRGSSNSGFAANRLKGIEMAIEKGSAFLLKVGDGGDPIVYTTIAGLRTTQMSINAETVVVTNKGSGGWRELLSGAGVRSVSLSGAGVFSGSVAETRIKASALAGSLDDYEVSFESGEQLRGRFLLTRLDYAGDFNGERSYTLALESSGLVDVA